MSKFIFSTFIFQDENKTKIHLYTSHPPCGDASIFNFQQPTNCEEKAEVNFSQPTATSEEDELKINFQQPTTCDIDSKATLKERTKLAENVGMNNRTHDHNPDTKDIDSGNVKPEKNSELDIDNIKDKDIATSRKNELNDRIASKKRKFNDLVGEYVNPKVKPFFRNYSL